MDRSILELLKGAGYAVETAATPGDALAAADRATPGKRVDKNADSYNMANLQASIRAQQGLARDPSKLMERVNRLMDLRAA